MNRLARIAFSLLLAALLPALASGSLPIPESRAVVQGVLDAAVSAQERKLRVHFIDVGQGDAILIVSPDKRAVLVDGGPRSGAGAVLDVMREEGVESLDLVIASHPHLDHIGGLQTVIETAPVRYYMDPGYPHPTRAYERLLETLEELEIPVLEGRAGRRVNLGGDTVLEVLAPDESLHRGTRSDANANSIVARIELGDFSVLLTGDAEAETESRLIALPELESTVLKVPHHGGRHSATAQFLQEVSPEAAVIQVGANNSYGHPHPDVLERLEEVGARIYRNDIHGTVTIVSDGETYTVTTEKRTEGDQRAQSAAREGEGAAGRERGPPVAN